jgi:hypothetical protein
MKSPIDHDGAVKHGKDKSQYTNLNPSIKGGDLGSKDKTRTGLPEGTKGKDFKGR